MLVDRRATSHLVGSDQPFISPWEEVVGELTPMGPPTVPVDTERDNAPVDVTVEGEVLGRGEAH